MITESQIYWITRLDSIVCVLSTLSIISLIVVLLLTLGLIVNLVLGAIDEEEKRRARLIGKITAGLWVFTAIAVAGAVFTPTTKEMAMIKIIPAISNSKFVAEELPKDARELYDLAKKEMVRKLTEAGKRERIRNERH